MKLILAFTYQHEWAILDAVGADTEVLLLGDFIARGGEEGFIDCIMPDDFSELLLNQATKPEPGIYVVGIEFYRDRIESFTRARIATDLEVLCPFGKLWEMENEK